MTIQQSLRLLRTEAVITSMVIAMPIMNLFFESIGLSQGQIGLSQAIFTVAVLFFNIPTGWLADRFSRKVSNALGDTIAAGGFLFYASADSFLHVIIAEIIIGIGLAFTQGADVGLLRAYCQRLKRDYRREASLIATLQPLFSMAGAVIGGIVGAHSPRLALLLTAVPFMTGALLSLFVKEVGTHRTASTRETPEASLRSQLSYAFKDMRRITVYALHGHKDLAWSIIAAAIAKEITHAIVWILTPLLLLAGVPAEIVGVAWALNLGAVSIGAWLSRRFAQVWSERALFVAPAVASLAAMVMLAISVNLWTIGLYAIFGLARGWYLAIMPPIVQHHTPDDMQSTVFSVSASLSQILYITVVILVNMIGDFGVQWAMAINAALFAPLVVIVAWRLRASL